MMAKKSPDTAWKQQRRLRALVLKNEGWSHAEVAEVLGVTKGAVSQWMKLVAEEGESGLLARLHKGAAPKLTLEEKTRLPELLSRGPVAYGFRGDLWTCHRVAQVIWREFSVSYHKDHVGRILKQVGWTPQKPETVAAQRNEEQIARWPSEVWPELKKRLSESVEHWSLLMKRRFICCLGW